MTGFYLITMHAAQLFLHNVRSSYDILFNE